MINISCIVSQFTVQRVRGFVVMRYVNLWLKLTL